MKQKQLINIWIELQMDFEWDYEINIFIFYTASWFILYFVYIYIYIQEELINEDYHQNTYSNKNVDIKFSPHDAFQEYPSSSMLIIKRLES
jgi:hypothetical protein